MPCIFPAPSLCVTRAQGHLAKLLACLSNRGRINCWKEHRRIRRDGGIVEVGTAVIELALLEADVFQQKRRLNPVGTSEKYFFLLIGKLPDF